MAELGEQKVGCEVLVCISIAQTQLTLSTGIVQGMKRFDARKSVESALREAGLYRGEVDHEMQLPVCRFVVAAVS